MDRKELQNLSKIRLREARALFELGYFDGAYYLAGYAVECALKACIAKSTRRGEFPDRKRVESSHTHNLRELIRVAGLDDELAAEFMGRPEFKDNWNCVRNWTEHSRYQRCKPEAAQAMISAASDRQYGVIAWIKQRW